MVPESKEVFQKGWDIFKGHRKQHEKIPNNWNLCFVFDTICSETNNDSIELSSIKFKSIFMSSHLYKYTVEKERKEGRKKRKRGR